MSNQDDNRTTDVEQAVPVHYRVAVTGSGKGSGFQSVVRQKAPLWDVDPVSTPMTDINGTPVDVPLLPEDEGKATESDPSPAESYAGSKLRQTLAAIKEIVLGSAVDDLTQKEDAAGRIFVITELEAEDIDRALEWLREKNKPSA